MTDEIGAPMREQHYDVAIVGGGFSGTISAIQLLRRAEDRISVAVINRSGRPGRGIAYSTQYEDHRLNVGAGTMSAFPDIPEHFLMWLAQKTGRSVGSDKFLARRIYGEYIEDILNQTVERHPQSTLSWIDGNAVSLRLEGGIPRLEMESGVVIESRVVVLAMGNAPPAAPLELRGVDEDRYAPYAWADSALQGIPAKGAVLILGSGLTAVDQVLALCEQKFRGTMFMVSRRGQLPAAHSTSIPIPWPSDWANNLPNSTRLILSSVRREIRVAASAGADWRAVTDSLRPASQQIWQRLPVPERKRFLRHVRSYWEVARHRVPEENHRQLHSLIANGALCLIAGRLVNAKEHNSRLTVTISERGTQKEHVLCIHRIINCTGPGTASRVQDELVLDLLHQGVARYDPLQIGIDTDQTGSLIATSGEPSSCVYAIGPMRKGSLWETTAVAEIRLQAAHLANHILDYLNHGQSKA